MEQHELRAWEAKCIQEEPPYCQAACPIHVDVRTFMAHMAKGRWIDARKVLDRTMPLPSVLGRICDHPCEGVCKRREAGEAIAIGAMERACVERTAPGKLQKLPARGKRAAILGGGLSGLVAAWDLARKGHGVTLYCASDRLGGGLLDLPETLLPHGILAQELARMENLGIIFHRVGSLDRELLDKALSESGAVYVAFDAFADRDWKALGLEAYAPGGVQPDPVTLALDLPDLAGLPGQPDLPGLTGVFGGGLPGQGSAPLISQVAEGRRGAASIDRYLQGSSLTASREREGPYATRLFTSVIGVAPLPRVAAFTPETACTDGEALAEASRCLLCECLECVKTCVYLKHFKGYPKKYTREIYNNEAIVQGIHQANTLINSCARCGLCATVCPNDFNVGDLCASVRASMVARGKMPASAHDFALRDLAFNTSDLAAMARHEPGQIVSAYLFFPGCQLAGSSPGQVRRVYAHLRETLSGEAGGVGLMLNCCGAPADWAGRADLFAKSLDGVRAAWNALGQPTLVLACPTCVATFAAHAPELPTISLWEVLDRTGPDASAGCALSDSQSERPGPCAAREAGAGPVYALHDPCTARHAPAIRASVRSILARQGVRIEELTLGGEMTECCGYGGLMDAANPALARDTALRRAGRSPLPYVAYCAMCRDSLSRAGKPVTHILDLLFPEAAEAASETPVPGLSHPPGESPPSGVVYPPGETHPLVRRAPGFADRHETRSRLKNSLLRELWNEPGRPQQPHETIRLDIAPEVQQILDARRILLEDLQQVVRASEALGRKSASPGKDRFLAGHRLAAVTYWVEYSPVPGDPERFSVHNAWSHRMVLAEGAS